jgi:branched-chain amino acid transport system permease protein
METVVQTAVNALSLGGLYALLALGIALIFGIMGLINFAYGELMMIGGYALVLVSGQPLPIALATTAAVVVFAALLMERIAFRPVRNADPTTLLVTSFALSYLLQHVAILIFGSFPRSTSVGSGLDNAVHVGGIAVSKVDIAVIVVAALLISALAVVVGRTTTGIRMRAAAEDFVMARLVGVRADRIVAIGFAISGLLAATAAYFLVAQTGSVGPTFGVGPVLVAFIATIVGGLGSLPGAVVAGFGLGFVTAVFQQVLPDSLVPYREAFVFAVVLVTLIVRPEGLIPQRTRAVRV